MDVHRIQGIKFNFESLSDVELRNIHSTLVEKQSRIVGELALVENTLFDRSHLALFTQEGEA